MKITGYEKLAEIPSIEHAVPAAYRGEALRLANVGPEDDTLGVFPLDRKAAEELGGQIGVALDYEHYDWFLEPDVTEQ